MFWNTRANIFYKTGPCIACRNAALVNRNQRLEDRSVNSIIHQENFAAGPEPAIDLIQTHPNALSIKEME